jgi:hypothetical protein
MKTKTSLTTNSISRSPLRRGFVLIPLALACLALSPQARAVCEEGCDLTNENTFLGDNALVNNTTGNLNTATGYLALSSNTFGSTNTATGAEALFNNTGGNDNTANGFNALLANTTGRANTATGAFALYNNNGGDNTANGHDALYFNLTGSENTAIGLNALLNNTTGSNNIAMGFNAGSNLTTGSNNIDIGNTGNAGESNTIRIGKRGVQNTTVIAAISGATVPTGVAVIVDTTGRLGTTTSSARYKDAVQPMDKASEAILALKPVTFRYKHDLDPDGIPQFGLVAEEVEKVNPDLVVRDQQGRPYTVRYEAVNAMLLNEFLKEHRKGEQQDRKIEELEATVAKLQSALKEQAAQIQKVSAQLAAASPSGGGLEVSKSAPQVVLNNQR